VDKKFQNFPKFLDKILIRSSAVTLDQKILCEFYYLDAVKDLYLNVAHLTHFLSFCIFGLKMQIFNLTQTIYYLYLHMIRQINYIAIGIHRILKFFRKKNLFVEHP
jgi:hypothetical protein